MNLKNNPTLEQLANLLASVDDDAGHHRMWVENNGEVHITILSGKDASAGWDKMDNASIRFYGETNTVGNSFAGPDAAKDKNYVQLIFKWLMDHWEAGSTDYVD